MCDEVGPSTGPGRTKVSKRRHLTGVTDGFTMGVGQRLTVLSTRGRGTLWNPGQVYGP